MGGVTPRYREVQEPKEGVGGAMLLAGRLSGLG